ncbi:hypothetical protein [Tolypothrix sp. NIES-4075]|nr:hypothetical protein [Tolypothrix sp. NIES-4075]
MRAIRIVYVRSLFSPKVVARISQQDAASNLISLITLCLLLENTRPP